MANTCPQHGQFANKKEFELHLIEAHGVDASALPSDEFVEEVERIEGKRSKVKPLDMSVQAPPVLTTQDVLRNSTPIPYEQPVKRDPKPIKLTYKYEGECGKCFRPVKTWIASVKGEKGKVLVAFAHCPECNIQYADREVKELLDK